MPSHSLERCFRIRGFSPNLKGNKDRRIATLVHRDQSPTDKNDDQPQISIGQYQQLIDLLGKHHVSDSTATANKDETNRHTSLMSFSPS